MQTHPPAAPVPPEKDASNASFAAPFFADPFLARLAAGALFIVLAIITLTAMALYDSRQHYHRQAQDTTVNLARVLEQSLATELLHFDLALQAMAAEFVRSGLDPAALEETAARQRHHVSSLKAVRIANADGALVFSSPPVKDMADIADRDYFRQLRDQENGALLISRPLLGRVSQEWIVVLARRIQTADGRFAGVVVAPLPLRDIERLLATVDVGAHGGVGLRDGNLDLITRHPGSYQLALDQKGVSTALRAAVSASPDGTLTTRARFDDRLRMLAYRKVGDTPLTLIVSLAQDDYLASWRQEALKLATLGALLIFLTLLAAWRLARDRCQLQAHLRTIARQEEKFRTIADYSYEWENWIGPSGELRWVSPAVQRISGYSADECHAMPDYPLSMTFPEDRNDVAALFSDAVKGSSGNDVASRLRHKDGHEIWIAASWRPVFDAQGVFQGHRSSVRDVTERKRREMLDQLRTGIFEQLSGKGTLPETLNGIVRFIEYGQAGALCSILLLDAPEQRLRIGAAPSLPDFYNTAVDGLLIGEGVGACGTAAYRNERVIVESIATHPWWAAFSDLAARAGLAACWSEPIRDEAGQVLGTFAIYHRQPALPQTGDLALIEEAAHLASIAIERRRDEAALHRHNAELLALNARLSETQNQLLQSEKMSAVGQLAAGVAHEINNPLSFVSGNLSTLGDYTDDLLRLIAAYESCEEQLSPAQQSHLRASRQENEFDEIRLDLPALLTETRDGVDRVKEIVQSLKDFSHVGETREAPANLEDGLESTLNMVWNELKYKVELVREYSGIPEVPCVAGQINQVFMNLLVNAGQAIEERGRITLRSGSDADTVWVEIEDSGSGIPPEIAGRIFEPFFTTKPVGQGTGLGLSLSYSIIHKHGGQIEAHSPPGQGTRFRVTLPRNRLQPGG